MLTVACVYNGGRYSVEWIERLKRGVEKHLHVPHRFVCLTNQDISCCDSIPLLHDWPGFWCKIELFRAFEGPTLYIDLDAIVCGDITPLATGSGNYFYMWREEPRHLANSSLMFWPKSKRGLYDKFAADPAGFMAKYGGEQYPHFSQYGDQAFIADHCGSMRFWQKSFPNEWFHQFSFDGRLTHQPVIENTRISVCLGEPKFDQHPEAEIVQQHWIQT